jgi:ribose transport system ATP-binding protein
VRSVSDRVVVLRDGRVAGTAVTNTIDDAALVELIIGTAAERSETARVSNRSRAANVGETALAVHHLSGATVHDVSFEVAAGEILGLAGVRGSGFERVPYLITGAERAREGSIQVAARSWDAHRIRPRDAVANGMALVPADRGDAGGAMSMTVGENVAHFKLGALFRDGRGVLRQRDFDQLALARAEKFDIRPRDPRRDLGMLSGGNQQKVVLAKWLEAAPRVLLLHEPTQGVDIGARRAIYEIVTGVVERGTAVVWFSNDYEELAEECDRVLVMDRGQVVDEIVGGELSEDTLRRRVYRAALEGSTATEDVHA